MARLRNFAVWALAKLIVAGMFQDLEIERPSGGRSSRPLSHQGPRLVVANHPNGFVDVVVLIVAYGQYPRFVAKADLFRRWPLRVLLRLLGAIPISKSGEGNNETSFDEIHQALAKGETVALFPEGTVSDDERLHPLRTGAARMFLGAASIGVEDIEITPIGLTYMDKVALRTRALARVGRPVDMAALRTEGTAGWVADPSNRTAVRSITASITEALAALSPDFGSLEREARLLRVADLVLRSDLSDAYRDPPISETVDLARRIGRLPPEIEDEVLDRAGRYHLELAATELRDDQIAPAALLRDLVKSFSLTTIKLALVLPLALIGLVTNVLPVVLVIISGSAIRQPATKGTARMVTALVAFPSAWAFAIWTSGRTGWQLTLWVGMLVVGSVLLVIAISMMIDAVDAGLSWRKVRSRRALVDRILTVRSETVRYVTSVL